MPEQIEVKGDSTELWFAITAITLSEKKIENRGNGILDISLTINGTEVSFVDTIKELFARLEESVNERAAQIAYNTATLKPLQDLADTINKADWEIRNKIEDTFGVKLSDWE